MTNGWAIKNEHKIAIPLGFLYKIPSIIDNISYTLVSLIMHYFDSLDCVYYVSDVFDTNTGIWWYFDDDDITKISDLTEGVYMRETHKTTTTKYKVIPGSNIYCL